jgi:NhaA family Na+:H+ antiporter
MTSTTVSRPPRYLSERILLPFQRFTEIEASGGLVLLGATIVALLWANSPWAHSYEELWQTTVAINLGSISLSKPLLLWINDGLMAIFFFVVGLEIKREILVGELSSVRQAALPIVGALGGMVVPALLYATFNAGSAGGKGWGIPMATDIAFALGVMALLGSRVPTSLKIFLTALAIVDDIGAVLVIAFFYTSTIIWSALFVAAGVIALLIICNAIGIRHPLIYASLGFVLWVAFLQSGIHATIAGVLLALTIPARARIDSRSFLDNSRATLQEFEQHSERQNGVLINEEQLSAVLALEKACEHVQTPLQRLELYLHSWVTYLIMPIFALANAGVVLGSDIVNTLTNPVTLGVMVGLVVGKPLGIALFSWVAVRAQVAVLPEGTGWGQLIGVAVLGGIGFTMSLFIGELAFGASESLHAAKLGILIASLVAGIIGATAIYRTARRPTTV